MSNSNLVIGEWFSLSKGRPRDIEVLIGECLGIEAGNDEECMR